MNEERLDMLKGEMANGYEWDHSSKEWMVQTIEQQHGDLTKLHEENNQLVGKMGERRRTVFQL